MLYRLLKAASQTFFCNSFRKSASSSQDCFNKLGVGLGIGKGQKYTIGENK